MPVARDPIISGQKKRVVKKSTGQVVKPKTSNPVFSTKVGPSKNPAFNQKPSPPKPKKSGGGIGGFFHKVEQIPAEVVAGVMHKPFDHSTPNAVQKATGQAHGPSVRVPKVGSVAAQGVVVHAAKGGTKIGKVATEPALTVLAQVSRPGYAVGNSAAQIAENVQHHRPALKAVGKAAERGFALKQKRGFGEALHSLGVSKGLAGPLGFPLDVVSDPTTWVTAGAGSIAKKGAEEAALKATTRVARQTTRIEKKVVAARKVTAGKIANAEKKSAAQGVADVTSKPESQAILDQRAKLQHLESSGRGTSAKAVRIRANLENAGKATAKKVRKIEARPQRRAAKVADQATPNQALSGKAGERAYKRTAYDRHGNQARGGRVTVGFVTPHIPFTDLGGNPHTVGLNVEHTLGLGDTRLGRASRAGTRKVAPTVRASASSDRRQVVEAQGAAARSVGSEQHAYARIQREVDSLANSLPPEHYTKFIDHIERGDIRGAIDTLPSEYRPLAQHVEASLKHGIKQVQRAGYSLRPIRKIDTAAAKQHLADTRLKREATKRLRNTEARLAKVERQILVAKARGNTDRLVTLKRKRGGLKSVQKQIRRSGLANRPTLNRHVTKAQKNLDHLQELRRNQANGYFSHMRQTTIDAQNAAHDQGIQDSIESMMGHPSGGGAYEGGKASTTRRRRVVAPISKQNPLLEGEQKYSTDVPAVYGNAKLQQARMVAKGNRIQELAHLAETHGRVVKPVDVRLSREGKPVLGPVLKTGNRRIPSNIEVRPNESVYYIGTENHVPVIKELTPEQVRDAQRGYQTRVNDAGTKRIKVSADYPRKAGKLVILDKEAVGKFHELYGRPAKETGMLGKAQSTGDTWDKGMRVWKGAATGTPGFHIRNTIGDIAMALNDVPPTVLMRLAREAVSNTGYIRSLRKNVLAAGEHPRDAQIIDLRKSGKMTRKEWNRELERNGIVTGGQVGDLRHSAQTGEYGVSRSFGATRTKRVVANKLHVAGKGHAIRNAFQDRENLMRQAVYKYWREKGLSETAARAKTAKAMVDYVETTRFERATAKRIAPFYTFTARSAPKHVATLFSRPGKAASLEKLRHEVGFATGANPDQLNQEQGYKQALAGLPVGKQYVSAGLPGPQTYEQFPTRLLSGHPKQELAQQLRFAGSMLAPPLRWPIEFGPTLLGDNGYNLFFRGPIKAPSGDLVPAPKWAADLPASLRKDLAVKNYTDKKSGKRVVGWSGQASYILSQAPGLAQVPVALSKDINQRGQTDLGRTLGFLGIKLDTKDPAAAHLQAAFGQLASVDTELNRVNKSMKGAPKGELEKLTKQHVALTKLDAAIKGYIQKTSKGAGYKTPLYQPKKSTKKNDPFGSLRPATKKPWKQLEKGGAKNPWGSLKP